MAQLESKTKWDRQNTVVVTMKLNKNTDADIIQKLDSVSNKQGYIKDLIKADMADRWIPCSERLPEEGGHYLVTAIWDDKPIVASDDYYSYGWDDFGDKVIAWKELPESYAYKSGE